jgi:tetratricopeptide (TPR) repeat protein
VAIAAVVCAAATADAQPWAEGVSEDAQAAANTLFAEGNKLFAQEAHAPALAKYTQAIALWDHPLIRFNMAVTLVRLDRYLEAADAIDRALRFGKDPFPSAEQYRQATDYQKLIGGRVGTLEARCTQRGAQVSLDGKRWFTCPATQQARLLVGEHLVVGELAEHMTRSQRVVVTGAGTARIDLQLVRADLAVRYVYPTRRWIPWTVAGGGLAVGLAGLGFYLAGQSQLDEFSDNFARACPDGCDLDTQPALRDQRDRAMFQGTVGTSLMIAGGAAVIGGTVWALWFNRPQRIQPVVESTPTAVTVGARGTF